MKLIRLLRQRGQRPPVRTAHFVAFREERGPVLVHARCAASTPAIAATWFRNRWSGSPSERCDHITPPVTSPTTTTTANTASRRCRRRDGLVATASRAVSSYAVAPFGAADAAGLCERIASVSPVFVGRRGGDGARQRPRVESRSRFSGAASRGGAGPRGSVLSIPPDRTSRVPARRTRSTDPLLDRTDQDAIRSSLRHQPLPLLPVRARRYIPASRASHGGRPERYRRRG